MTISDTVCFRLGAAAFDGSSSGWVADRRTTRDEEGATMDFSFREGRVPICELEEGRERYSSKAMPYVRGDVSIRLAGFLRMRGVLEEARILLANN